MNKITKWSVTIGLSGFLTKLLDFVPWTKVFSKSNWTWIIESRFSVLQILIFVIIFIIILFIISSINYKKSKEDPIEKELKKYCFFEDNERGVKVTWNVSMGNQYNLNPHPYNINAFCTKHGEVPIKMRNGHCTYNGCPNSELILDNNILKNEIESRLIKIKEDLSTKR